MSEPSSGKAAPPPVQALAPSGEPQPGYLGRQPIIDADGRLFAYELLFRDDKGSETAAIENDAHATAHVLARAIGGIGVAAALGPHRGFVNLGPGLLFDDIVHLMDPARFVPEILETVGFDARVIARLAELRAAGFALALDDVSVLSDGLLEALPYVDFVKIDFLAAPRETLMELAATVRSRRHCRLIAEKIESAEDVELARELGCTLFQGYFFARPQVLQVPPSRAPRDALVRVLVLLARDADLAELEVELKHNPSLVVQLLRLVNSSAFGFTRHIGSLREAILAAGTRQIARWAQLLLYADGRNLPWRSDPLVELAGTRSRFMELAARRLRPGDEAFYDAAFMTGIFSLVHVVLGTTLDEALQRLGLSVSIRAAIAAQAGPLGALLRMAQCAEQGELGAAADVWRAFASTGAAEAGGFAALSPEVLAELNLAAAAWFGAHAAAREMPEDRPD